MGDTSIEWTDKVWNPCRGCSRVSEGCRHCYAETFAARFSDPGQPYHGLAERAPSGPRWTGKVALVPKHLKDPLRWRKPRRVFVNSMSDLFHESLPDEAIDKIFAVMAMCDGTRTNGRHHTFQILTKRPKRMNAYFSDPETSYRVHSEVVYLNVPGYRPNKVSGCDWYPMRPWPIHNVWLGVSVEDQKTADERIPLLLQTPAAVRFVSYEPALGSVDFSRVIQRWDDQTRVLDTLQGLYSERADVRPRMPFCLGMASIQRLDWIICGAESGPGARPFSENWARSVRDQCQAAGVAFFYKQNAVKGRKIPTPELDGRKWMEFPEVRP